MCVLRLLVLLLRKLELISTVTLIPSRPSKVSTIKLLQYGEICAKGRAVSRYWLISYKRKASGAVFD